MRVAFDEQIFLLQQQGGVSRYFVELMRQLPAAAPDLLLEIPFRSVANRHALEAFDDRFTEVRGPLQPYPALVSAATRRRRRASVDLVHHTFYSRRFLRDYAGAPKVVTIYDMIPEVVGAAGRFGNPHMAKREYVRRADLLLFISQSALDDLVAAYGVPSAPCVVTHLGVDDRFGAGGTRPAGFPDDYVLFVGKRDGYKDFATLLSAFSEAREELGGLALVCVGGGPFTDDERAAADRAGLVGRLHQYGLPDSEMPGAYANAAAYVFPSRYEGFGLPALEAMAAGTPAVLARTSSLPEVGGDAATYFAPGDGVGLATAMVEVLTDSALRSSLVARGRGRAADFTWTRTAEQTVAAYRTLLAGRERPLA